MHAASDALRPPGPAGPVRLALTLLLALSALVTVALPASSARAAAAPAAAPSVLALGVSATRLTVGATVTVTTRLQRTADGVPVAGRAVELWAAPAGTTAWVRVATATTDAQGRTATPYAPSRHTVLRATSAASPAAAAATSAVSRVDVAQAVIARLAAPAVREDTPATLSGTVAPARPGSRVVLQVLSRGAWRSTATTTQSATGAFRFTVTPSAPGWWRYRVTTPASPDLLAADRSLPALDAYRLHTYVVTRRGRAVPDLRAFADAVAATYAEAKGWRAAHRRFSQVASGGDLSVVLSEARYLPTYSRSCSTVYSCRVGRYVVINETRWRQGSRAFTGSLAQYRTMVVNHETGHWLGLGHASCPRRGAPAPVMQQQSKDLQGCAPNPWPLAYELDRATPTG